MAAEPITLYSHKIDPAGVAALLRQLTPSITLAGTEDNWTSLTITGPKRFLKKPWTLTFSHDRSYYGGTDFSRQLLGMQGYFSSFPKNELTPRIMLLIQSFRFALTLFPVPEPDLHIDSPDDRLPLLFAVAEHLDAALFTPSGLRDARGRVLYGAQPDPAAVMPAIIKEIPAAPRSQLPRSLGGSLPDADSPERPTPERVARRTLALAAVTGRALLEQEDHKDPEIEATRKRIIDWVEAINLGDELEPDEWKILQLPLGTPPQRDSINATWRIEGLAVLAWSLQKYALPPYDQLADPAKLLPALGILNVDRANALLAEPPFRPRDQIETLSEQLFALHWRIRNYRLKPEHMNFASFAKTASFGPLNISLARLVDDDLSLAGLPIHRASPDLYSTVASSLQERHLAINWLTGHSQIYSQTDTPT